MRRRLERIPDWVWALICVGIAALSAVLVFRFTYMPSPAVPTASSVLTSDGYTPTSSYGWVSGAVVADFQGDKSTISSWAIGLTGNSLEMVVVSSKASQDFNQVRALVPAGDMTVSGDVMKLSGPIVEFQGSIW